MFPVQTQPRRRPALSLSLALHAGLLAWLLHSPRPVFVAPSSVLGGVGGSSITQLYWPATDGGRDSSNSSLEERRPVTPPKPKLQLPTAKPETLAYQQEAAPSPDSDSNPATPGRSAGSPYGSLSEGPDAGHEIRPALPAATFEPQVSGAGLAGIAEGNCIVEITIDESGAVVAQSVVQSMGALIDEAVLAAVSQWRFRPATRDGVPIPSRQDVVYHFKPRS